MLCAHPVPQYCLCAALSPRSTGNCDAALSQREVGAKISGACLMHGSDMCLDARYVARCVGS